MSIDQEILTSKILAEYSQEASEDLVLKHALIKIIFPEHDSANWWSDNDIEFAKAVEKMVKKIQFNRAVDIKVI